MIDRRVELGYHSREAFIRKSGIGARTVGDIETARRGSYNPATLARLERALEWPSGRAALLVRMPEAHSPPPPGSAIPLEVVGLLNALDDLDDEGRNLLLRQVALLTDMARHKLVQRPGRIHRNPPATDSDNGPDKIGQQPSRAARSSDLPVV
ncbi:MAG TPA: hypothetical protein VK453_25710 [Micromonosporaceae bacterium]|nr:hypothetical protein [Micromonosporaceae bacterium]